MRPSASMSRRTVMKTNTNAARNDARAEEFGGVTLTSLENLA
jgi:hypothetical protein